MSATKRETVSPAAEQSYRPAWARDVYQRPDEIEYCRQSVATFVAGSCTHPEPYEQTAPLSRVDDYLIEPGGVRIVQGPPIVYLDVETIALDQVPNLIAALQELVDAAAD